MCYTVFFVLAFAATANAGALRAGVVAFECGDIECSGVDDEKLCCIDPDPNFVHTKPVCVKEHSNCVEYGGKTTRGKTTIPAPQAGGEHRHHGHHHVQHHGHHHVHNAAAAPQADHARTRNPAKVDQSPNYPSWDWQQPEQIEMGDLRPVHIEKLCEMTDGGRSFSLYVPSGDFSFNNVPSGGAACWNFALSGFNYQNLVSPVYIGSRLVGEELAPRYVREFDYYGVSANRLELVDATTRLDLPTFVADPNPLDLLTEEMSTKAIQTMLTLAVRANGMLNSDEITDYQVCCHHLPRLKESQPIGAEHYWLRVGDKVTFEAFPRREGIIQITKHIQRLDVNANGPDDVVTCIHIQNIRLEHSSKIRDFLRGDRADGDAKDNISGDIVVPA